MPSHPFSATASILLPSKRFSLILALLLLRQTRPAFRLAFKVFQLIRTWQSSTSMIPLHLLFVILLSSMLTTDVIQTIPLQLFLMLFLAMRNFSQCNKNMPCPRAPSMWLLQMQLSMLWGPSRIKLQLRLPEIWFFSRKAVPPLQMYTPLPKVAVTSLRKICGCALLSILMPTFWFNLTKLLLTSDLFLEPQTSSPPFLFSAIRLKRRVGQHYPFCRDQLHIPYSLFPTKLFFMTFGLLFQTSIPYLHSLISLFMMLLLLPKRVMMPAAEQSLMLLFSTELQKGPLSTIPSAHLDIVEFLQIKLVQGPPLIQTAMPP